MTDPNSAPAFVGRQEELAWLTRRLSLRHSRAPIVVAGPAGIGKTTLVQHALTSLRDEVAVSPVFLDLSRGVGVSQAMEAFESTIRRDPTGGHEPNVVVVVDGAEGVPNHELLLIVQRIRNFKRVRSVVLVARDRIHLRGSEELFLGGLSAVDVELLLRNVLPADATESMVAGAVAATDGHPLAANLLAQLFATRRTDAQGGSVTGRLYDVESLLVHPNAGVVAAAAPRIVSATDALVDELRRRPEFVHELHPRQFEELLADLLSDRGWDVRLTPATRDGGKDILAYLDTDVGRLLCLVEAKKYGREHKVGVELVRALYGTLCDYQANSAMLVTTSSFTSGAKEFQEKHPYQLSLRDYVHVGQWIKEYRR